MLHELAGKPAPRDLLISIPRLLTAYYANTPDPHLDTHSVRFGTSGHRGVSFDCSFNEHHVLAISQAVCDLRRSRAISGPLYLGKDTHALSEPAYVTALEVFAANDIEIVIQSDFGFTPTPVISHAILTYNRDNAPAVADGVVITPSHNPPEHGGYKYNPPAAGPADGETTSIIQDRANEHLRSGLKDVRRLPFARALNAASTHHVDYIAPYVADLQTVLDLEIIAASGIKIGVDPMGGSGLDYWDPIAERYRLDIEVVNRVIDPTFSFMTLDKDGQVRMDCSSPQAMARLIGMKDKFDIAVGNDPDYDRHGIVTKSVGLLNPNHYLSVAIWYLFRNRPHWSRSAAIGKTLVSSSMIDRVAAHLQRDICELPVGFKWLAPGLLDGSFGFAGEESAGASFLRKDGTVWTTDKDGILLDLLAAEITAKTGRDPGIHYHSLEERFGRSEYQRIDVPANDHERTILKDMTPDSVGVDTLAGEPIIAALSKAPGNNQPIGGLKLVTENGWFAARPSGTEEIYKIYAESFRGADHLSMIQEEAREIIGTAISKR